MIMMTAIAMIKMMVMAMIMMMAMAIMMAEMMMLVIMMTAMGAQGESKGFLLYHYCRGGNFYQ